MMKTNFTLIGLLCGILATSGWAQQAIRYPPEQFLKVVTIFTNDIHGGIDRREASFINPDFPPMLGGGAVAGRYILQQRATAAQRQWGFLLLDAGDFYQGTPLGTMSEGEAVVQYMNTVGYDALTVGNHDFDHGWQNLRQLADSAKFPFLAANLYRQSTGELAEFVKPYIIKTIQGIKIGIIGIATAVTPSMSFPEHVEDLDFRSEIPVLKQLVPKLKLQGVHFIIVETHAWLDYNLRLAYDQLQEDIREGKDFLQPGASAMQIARMVPGIDVIFSGHLHRGYYEPWEDPVNHTLIFQNYANGSNLGHVNFYLHRASGTLAGYDFVSDESALFTLFEDDFLPDTSIARRIDAWVQKAEAGFDEVIGTAQTNLTRSGEGETPMGNLVTDAMRWSVNADLAFSNFGGVRADIPAGPITPRHVFGVMPFGNRIVVMNVSGEFIKQLVEDRVSGQSRGMLISGARIVIDRTQPDGQRVSRFEIGGQALEPSRIYRLAVSDYLAEGNSGFERLTTVDSRQINYTGILLRQAIIDYIRKNSPIRTQIDGRWQDLSAK
jgi:2',3'-cyclic-nucleotide 2'-phosphodiesterase (5'-nucleotidase family)